ncbi:hypothetical protein CYV15_02735 [Riemerella anatipestifer]|nr:hypothetical protein [Riemerella anatipestifer]ADQ82413.1 hypothetical protein Riean_1255 [Riemerella anatipestifer ATCC 11845 = DSM 15868]AKQ39859.1 hypothetical protein AS87_05920 [Riemerella anatipestifer Yb2]EFT36815.1 hypothetical protein RAYM_00320 [Riemerella anatipestifer RA-YM]MBT0525729.1 hypothetical protein [Riemerella anatipestifer]MBT0527572.1 hypothetical protein [Riemerella anatipestifer]
MATQVIVNASLATVSYPLQNGLMTTQIIVSEPLVTVSYALQNGVITTFQVIIITSSFNIKQKKYFIPIDL